MIKLIECFRTFQGEGPDSGRAMLLLRFKYCNQNCYFCDTSVKMRISQEGTYTIPQIQSKLNEYRCGLLITGGEPTFSPHYNNTIILLENLRYGVANVETNGHQLKKMLAHKDWTTEPVKFIYSPKIFCEKSLYKEMGLTKDILSHKNVYIKIPYLKTDYVDRYCNWLRKEIIDMENSGKCFEQEFDNRVWLLPLGDNYESQKRNSSDVMDACEKYCFNFTGRSHIMYDFI